jgi:FAD/FMN-containing dehydrogenase
MTSIVGEAHVLIADDRRAGYEIDWTGRYTGRALLVVRPGDVDDVVRIMRTCSDQGVAVVPQAGNTGLVGGGVPRGATTTPTIVLSLRRLDAISEVDGDAMHVTAGAGVTIADWQSTARAGGLDTPVDFAARASATIGGAIATNAGGSRVLRFGTMRQQVLGIEAVLADGSIVGSLNGLPKETVGLHWPSVLSGSEGTLGIITAARLRLVPRFDHVVTAMVSTATIADAVSLVGLLRHRVGSLDSVELILPDALELVSTHLGVGPPIDVTAAAAVVLVECADHADPTQDLADVLGASAGIIDTAVTDRRDRLIRFRDSITDAIAADATVTGVPTFKLDVAVPLGAITTLLDAAQSAARDDGARLIPFGHLAEGNLHLNFLGTTAPERIAETVLAETARLGGTISAEHGVGIAKTPWLHLVRTSDDLAAQRAIKHALDPHGILNPGVLQVAPVPGTGVTG